MQGRQGLGPKTLAHSAHTEDMRKPRMGAQAGGLAAHCNQCNGEGRDLDARGEQGVGLQGLADLRAHAARCAAQGEHL